MTAGLHISFTGDDEAADAWSPSSATETPVLGLAGASQAQPAGQQAPTPGPKNTPPRQNGLTSFEGAPVARTEIKISGATSVNTNDGVEVSMDDRIRVVGQFRVTKVTFAVDKNGDVVRTQHVAPDGDLELTPWDPGNPNDDGIVRVRPVQP